MTDKSKIEAAAREMADRFMLLGMTSETMRFNFIEAFKAGHASRDAEVAALRQRLAELEWMVPKWVPDGHPANDLFISGWRHHLQNTEGPVKLVLMVPPVPLPGEET